MLIATHSGLLSSSTIWVLLGAALVFFMQAGFVMVEAGLTRAKNAGNIIMKNIADFAFGSIVYWLVGFSIMFGTSVAGFFGVLDFGLFGETLVNAAPEGVSPWAFLIFQTVFCATAATIVSGAMAERTKFSSYCVYTLIISALVYPIEAHWIWGGGWLSGLGFHDFAGSTVVHMTGGIAALVGAKILGPRIGKFTHSGKSKPILGHNLPIAALGVFILWFGWFGFNGASTVSADGDEALSAMGHIFVTTNLSAAAGTVGALVLTWILFKKPDVSMTLNGALAGLVGITAGCDAVSPLSAIIIGLLSGLLVVWGVLFIDHTLKIDDPVGAVAVHGVCGAFGTLAVGLFAAEGGLFTGGGFGLLGIQVLGVLSVAAFVGIIMTLAFLAIKATMGLRVSAIDELTGLDITEHGLPSAYADFVTTIQSVGPSPEEYIPPVSPDPIKEIKFTDLRADKSSSIFQITIITRPAQFAVLDTALQEIGIPGLTVTDVKGYGTQKGHFAEQYRGDEIDTQLVPKIKVDAVVSNIKVEDVVNAAAKALHTGTIGDGKIFITDVLESVRISSGVTGSNAIGD